MPDYEFKTTFWSDFSIADNFGLAAIKDTFKRAFDEWKDDVVYLTELALVTNWKCWEWYQKNDEYSKAYSDMYYKVNDYAYDNLKGDDLTYYFDTTD